jgi:type II secretory ATPase GspE/PulE/Tfp pilus assembly ATPase PilB-like protein
MKDILQLYTMPTIRTIPVLEHLDYSARVGALLDLARNHRIVPYRSRNDRPNPECMSLWHAYAKASGVLEAPGGSLWLPVGNIGPLLIVGHHLQGWEPGHGLPLDGKFPEWAVGRVVINRAQYDATAKLVHSSIDLSYHDNQTAPQSENFLLFAEAPNFADEHQALGYISRHYPLGAAERAALDKYFRRGLTGAIASSSGLPEGFREQAIMLHRKGVPVVDLRDCVIPKETAESIPENVAARFSTAAFAEATGLLFVAAPDPDSYEFSDNLLNRMSLDERPEIIIALCAENRCQHAFTERGGAAAAAAVAAASANAGNTDLASMEGDASAIQNTKVEVEVDPEKAKMIDYRDRGVTAQQLYHCILYNAVQLGASDIHFEYFFAEGQVRFRVDGVCRVFCRPPIDVFLGIIAILKNDATLASSNYQGSDGRFSFRCEPHHCDVRVNAIPYRRDRLKITCRLMDKGRNFRKLEDLNLDAERFTMIERVLQSAQGMVLVTGPTGSGKSTTIYAMLAHINKTEINIQTVEDPVEYEIEGLNQTMINKDRKVTYDVVLPLLLRSDPDVIFIGEIRDEGMAKLATEASQTGHLVLSTLHTNSTTETIQRLAEMGVPSYILAESLSLITANRLIQRNCPHCVDRSKYTPEMLAVLGRRGIKPDSDYFRVSKGCPKCGGTGYKGQMAVMEFCPIDQDFKDLISQSPNPKELRDLFKKKGFLTLYEEGMRQAVAGNTDFNAILLLAGAWEEVVIQSSTHVTR